MHFNCRNLNGTVLLQSLITSCSLYTWEQTNSSNTFAANLTIKGSVFLLTLYIPSILNNQLSFVIAKQDKRRKFFKI